MPNTSPRRDDLRVAVILDEFSALSFDYEWSQCALTLKGWKEEIDSDRPDFLFVESAWSGNGGAWKYQLTGENGPKPEFRQLLEYSRSLGVPTVFWNKEDPPHYDDFLEAAKLFDFVFTSDSDQLPRYRRDLGHGNLGVLQFAAQPAIHNPIRPANGWHDRDVAFAGMYFVHKYPERREQLTLLLAAAEEATAQRPHGLEIFARHAGRDVNYQFPAPYNKRVVGALSYGQMLSAYKAYKVFLNANSVVESPSMCARRIFEITAAGATVVSTPSRALELMWPSDEQYIVRSQDEARETLAALIRNPALSDRQLHRAQRRIWAEHTYSHRAESVISAALPSRSQPIKRPLVSLLVATMRPHQLEHVFRTVGSFVGVDVELVLVPHGFSVPGARIKRLAERYGVENLTLAEQPGSVSLGECLNAAVTASSGAVLSKMDDDDFYAPHYLEDLLNALKYSGAELVGKKAHYVQVVARNATLIRYENSEHVFTNSVMGPTITAPREVFESNPFLPIGRGEDTQFLRSIRASGGLIYSADRYNYCQVRGGGDHTWKISDSSIIASGDIQLFGSFEEHIVI
ncbi:hypothetical protein ABIB35_001266 [Arthrobacter sp. UYP6]|uniref:glycosyltransferase family protein n=1 Tax=Arthrobacter sp. UYP6 TaxID=1756378 RepID=UPI0033973014